MKFVIAADYDDFLLWCRQNDKRPNFEATYVRSSQQLSYILPEPVGRNQIVWTARGATRLDRAEFDDQIRSLAVTGEFRRQRQRRNSPRRHR